MSLNKFYDIIISKHKEYLLYNEFLEKTKLDFKDKRQSAVEKVYQLNFNESKEVEELIVPEEFTNLLYDLKIEETIYMQDLQNIFYTLYLNVKTYLEIGDGMILPKEITELCESLEYLIPKPFFVVDSKLSAKETEKGRLEQRKESLTKGLELEQIKNIVLQAIKAQENTKE